MRHTLVLLALVALLAPNRAHARPAEPVTAAAVKARLVVRGDGWVRIPAAKLKELSLKAATIHVARHGVPVASVADDGDLVFLAVDTAGPYTRDAAFEVRDGAPPTPPTASLVASPGPRPEAVTTIDRRRFAPDNFFGARAASRKEVYAAPAPVWFAGMIDPNTRTTFELLPVRGEPTGPQHLAVQVFGTHIGKITLRATWGSHDLGESSDKSAAAGTVLAWTIPEEVAASSGRLVLTDLSPRAPKPLRNDVSAGRGRIWVDVIDLAGPVAVPITVGAKDFVDLDVQAGATIAFDAAPRYAAIVDHQGVPRGTAAKWTGEAVVTAAQVGRLCIGPATREATVTPARKFAHPMVAAGKATHVIVATPPLVQDAKVLAKHRTATGTPSVVIPVLDVYDTYGQGEHSPRAIRQFVLALMGRQDAPLDYLVLAGDATSDRTDLIDEVTIPTPMARTKYNGATASDRLYAKPANGSMLGGCALGRLPFRDADAMAGFVRRVIKYETETRPDLTRNMLRFITSEGRFGAFVDNMLESAFRKILTELDPAFDIEVTFASLNSAFLWPPPEFNDKVIEALNEGSLFFTYIGHGFAQGFDTLRVGGQYFPILNMEHVERVAIAGTPPTLFILACTTAQFDARKTGIGEALLARENGPIAFWGATRICHPAANTLLGHSLAHHMTRAGRTERLGGILSKSADYAIQPDPREGAPTRTILNIGVGMATLGEEISAKELAEEASLMYVLLGDPATKLAMPRRDVVQVGASIRRNDAENPAKFAVDVTVKGDFPDGTTATITLEHPRNIDPSTPKRVANSLDPKTFPTIRKNHRAMNDRVIVKTVGTFQGGTITTTLKPGSEVPEWVVKAIVLTKTDVHHGAVYHK